MPSSRHIVSSYEDELRRLGTRIGELGRRASAQVRDALDVLGRRDRDAADAVVRRDAELDALDREIGEDALKLLALRQPMACDLREVVAAIRIAQDLERIGDLAKNAAKRTHALEGAAPNAALQRIARMGELARRHLEDVVAAYRDRDAARALAVWRGDEEVDDWFHGVFRELLTYMMEDPRTIGLCAHLLFVAKNVERIGDHAANIAATVHYLVEGSAPPEARPKGEDTAFAVVEPPR